MLCFLLLCAPCLVQVATPLQQAWASPGRGDRYKENPDPASDNDATVEGSNPMRAHHQEEGRGHRGDSCEEARPARTPAEEEAWRMLNSLEEVRGDQSHEERREDGWGRADKAGKRGREQSYRTRAHDLIPCLCVWALSSLCVVLCRRSRVVVWWVTLR